MWKRGSPWRVISRGNRGGARSGRGYIENAAISAEDRNAFCQDIGTCGSSHRDRSPSTLNGRGKLAFDPKMDIATRHDLAVAYTPGVAEPCKVIAENPEAAYDYTLKGNTVAVVTDGSAVLGLGNIGPEAAMPVMEGKAALFKAFGGVDAFPICLDTQDTDEIVETVIRIAPAFGGINLEDIAAPRCFEIEARLNDALDIPVFHDDQHGTAIVVLSGIINALRLVGKDKESVRVVVNGAGSAGIAIAKLLLSYGFANVTLCDRFGIVSSAYEGMNDVQRAMLAVTNLEDKSGTLADAMEGADIVIGVSAPGVITRRHGRLHGR